MMLNNIAVLIDGDNASSKNIDAILNKISEFGTITLKKIYGDWRQTNLSGWQEAILQYAIDPMQQFAYVKGKNATDIALVIEAMDLLHSKKYDAFCLVSSDSDFTSLALRIRKNDIKVFGFGKQTTVKSLQTACDEFFEVETLSTPVKKDTSSQIKSVEPYSGEKLKSDTKLLNALRNTINDEKFTEDGWVEYRNIVGRFRSKYPDINIESYGYSRLIDLIRKIDIISINYEIDGTFIKLKNKEHPHAILSTIDKKSSTEALQNDKALVNVVNTILQENTEAQDGWSSLHYITGKLSWYKRYHLINFQKHGYKKFSDLIIAMDLFDIKKENKQIYVKIKNLQPKNPSPASPKNPVNHTTVTSNTQEQKHQPQNSQLILTGKIDIQIHSSQNIDNVLWRLTPNKKVRHDGDIIFYGQTHTSNDTIVLNNTDAIDNFYCDLDKQDDDVSYILLTASHENATIDTPIKIIIKQNGETFYNDTYTSKQSANSVLLFALAKTKDGWKIGFEYRPISHTLLQLCQFFGVEVG